MTSDAGKQPNRPSANTLTVGYLHKSTPVRSPVPYTAVLFVWNTPSNQKNGKQDSGSPNRCPRPTPIPTQKMGFLTLIRSLRALDKSLTRLVVWLQASSSFRNKTSKDGGEILTGWHPQGPGVSDTGENQALAALDQAQGLGEAAGSSGWGSAVAETDDSSSWRRWI